MLTVIVNSCHRETVHIRFIHDLMNTNRSHCAYTSGNYRNKSDVKQLYYCNRTINNAVFYKTLNIEFGGAFH